MPHPIEASRIVTPRRFRGRMAKIALATVTVALGLAAGEAYCRQQKLIAPYCAEGEVITGGYPATGHRFLGFSLPPNWEFRHWTWCDYRTNGDGFRDEDEIPANKPTDERWALLCGDSFTLGWGMAFEDTYGEVAERTLNATSENRWRSLNAGYRSGYTLDQYYTFLVRESAKWPVDDVVVALYLGNDVDDLRHNRWRRLDEHGLPAKISPDRQYIGHDGRFIDWKNYDPALPGFLREFRLGLTALRFFRQGFPWPKPTEEAALERADRLIRGIDRHCRDHGRRLTWLLIPPYRYTGESNRFLKLCRRVFGDLDSRFVVVEEILPEAGLPRESLFIPGDFHFTVPANRCLGKVLARKLADRTP